MSPGAAIVGLSALLLTVAAPDDVDTGRRGRGLYVWDEAVRMTDGGADDRPAQRALLGFCRAPDVDVRRIYLLVDPERTSRASLGRLLDEAAARGIEVFALAPGSIQDRWAAPFRRDRRGSREVVLDWLERALALGAGSAGFAGVQLDVEIHRARSRGRLVWKPNRRLGDSRTNRRLAAEWLALLDAVRAALHARDPSLQLAVTMPTWFDGPGFRLEYDGRRRSLARHAMDRAAFVSLMNYVDGGSGRAGRRALDAIRDELAHGRVESVLETQRLGRRHRAETLYEEGERGYLRLRALLERTYDGSPNWIGTAAHHYRHAYGSGTRRWPSGR